MSSSNPIRARLKKQQEVRKRALRNAQPDLYLVSDIATALGIDRRTLATYLAADDITVYTFLRCRYVDWTAFLLWLQTTDREKIVTVRTSSETMKKVYDVRRGKR